MEARKLLRLRDVMAQTGLSRASDYKLIADGSFPRQIPITERSVAWEERAVQGWIEAKLRPYQN